MIYMYELWSLPMMNRFGQNDSIFQFSSPIRRGRRRRLDPRQLPPCSAISDGNTSPHFITPSAKALLHLHGAEDDEGTQVVC